MVDQETARKELLERYQGSGIEKAAYFQDYVKISAALGSGMKSKEMLAGLKALETAMIDRIVANYKAEPSSRDELANNARKHWNARRATYWKEYPKKPNKEENLSHVLTATLEQHERDDGFQQLGAKVPVYADVVDSGAFIQALKDRRHWKDVGAGKGHGEFTHRIQWYLLSSGGVVPQQDKRPAAVFSTLGDYRRGNKYLWDDLCDRPLDPNNDNEWRAPAGLNNWLTSPTGEGICPVLSTFVRFRFDKRELVPSAYIVRKLGLKTPPKSGSVSILDFDDGQYKARK
jgi:hypothetical protein